MSSTDRLHALDAVRAFALLLGVMFHAGFSFIPGMIPGLWAIVDNSPSTTISVMAFASHIFRMTLFFFVAGFFARMMYLPQGRARLLARSREAHPAAARGRLDDLLPDDRGRVDLGPDEDLRRQDSAPAREHARAAARRVPADASLVSLLPADPLRHRPARARGRSSRSIATARSGARRTRWCAASCGRERRRYYFRCRRSPRCTRITSGTCGSGFPRPIGRSFRSSRRSSATAPPSRSAG